MSDLLGIVQLVLVYFVLIYDPAAELLVLAFVETFILDDLVYRHVLEAQTSRKLLRMCGLANARRSRDDNVGILPRHILTLVKPGLCEFVEG